MHPASVYVRLMSRRFVFWIICLTLDICPILSASDLICHLCERGVNQVIMAAVDGMA